MGRRAPTDPKKPRLPNLVLSKILLGISLVLLALKFGLRTRLRELGRIIDRWVNIALVVIIVSYVAQLAYMALSR